MFINFHTCFLSQEGHRGKSPRTQNTSWFLSIWGSSGVSKPSWDQAKSDAIKPSGPVLISGLLPLDATSRACIFCGTFWSCGWSIVVEIFLFARKVAQHSWLCKFHSCGLCHKVLHCELFTKIISLPPVHEISLFEPLPKIHDHSDDWNKIELTLIALWCLKLLCCDHRALKFTQNCICFTNPFINRPVTRWGAGVALPPWKNVLDIV